jgi:hypothetical protein
MKQEKKLSHFIESAKIAIFYLKEKLKNISRNG